MRGRGPSESLVRGGRGERAFPIFHNPDYITVLDCREEEGPWPELPSPTLREGGKGRG